ncbi:MAG: substrate-binding domain-containing protein [Desulfurococcus sp.]|nr:substrate-binding domain-containing protein [Desulfurococcus sp.]
MDTRTKLLVAVAVVAIAVVAGVAYYKLTAGSEPLHIRATTTTSLYQTGLLDALAGEFRKINPNVVIDFIPVGTGEALKRAAGGDACLVLVHAPSLERTYMSDGVIEYQKIFAYNYFIIVGPSSDPAGVGSAKSAIEAFQKIYAAGEAGKALFISRGDNSGTHVKELELWRKAGLNPEGKQWYIEAGQGMGQTLVMSDERGAYTLSDIGTYLKYKKEGRIPSIKELFSGDENLINIYSAYLVSSCGGRERDMAKAFIDFIAGSKGQELIRSFGVQEYGGSLFYPASDKLAELAATWQKIAEGG